MIKTTDRSPEAEVPCRLRRFGSEDIQEHRLVKVDESDCDWRNAKDRSGIKYNWDVIEWDESIDQSRHEAKEAINAVL